MPRRIPVRRSAAVQTESVANSKDKRISCELYARASAAIARFPDGTANTALLARRWPACSGSGPDAASGEGRSITSIHGSNERTATRTRHGACATNICADIERSSTWQFRVQFSEQPRTARCRQDDGASTGERGSPRLRNIPRSEMQETDWIDQ